MSLESTDLPVSHEFGSGDKLVVFVHGVLDRGRSFKLVAEELAGKCRMLWYDRRGYGSSVDLGTDSGVGKHADDLVRILHGRRAILVGHSFGGNTALAVAARVPQQVEALVLYETSLAFAPGWDDSVLATVFEAEDMAIGGLRMIMPDRLEKMNSEELAKWRREGAAFVSEELSMRQYPLPYELRDVRAPVVYGIQREGIMPMVSDHLREVISDFELAVIQGADHMVHRSRPGEFANLIRRFL